MTWGGPRVFLGLTLSARGPGGYTTHLSQEGNDRREKGLSLSVPTAMTGLLRPECAWCDMGQVTKKDGGGDGPSNQTSEALLPLIQAGRTHFPVFWSVGRGLKLQEGLRFQCFQQLLGHEWTVPHQSVKGTRGASAWTVVTSSISRA